MAREDSQEKYIGEREKIIKRGVTERKREGLVGQIYKGKNKRKDCFEEGRRRKE